MFEKIADAVNRLAKLAIPPGGGSVGHRDRGPIPEARCQGSAGAHRRAAGLPEGDSAAGNHGPGAPTIRRRRLSHGRRAPGAAVIRHPTTHSVGALGGAADLNRLETVIAAVSNACLARSAMVLLNPGTVAIAFFINSDCDASCHGLPCASFSTSRSGASSRRVSAEPKRRAENASSKFSACFR
jgi:hypothetical protein